MSSRPFAGWKRHTLLTALLALGMLFSVAGLGQTRDDTKKADDPKAKTDEKEKKEEPKPAEKPESEPAGSSTLPAPTAAINQHLSKFWADNHVQPSARVSDYVFCRRVFLDILGRIPSIDEVKKFVAEGGNKRAKLVDRLLYDEYYKDEYERNWADIWTTLLMTRAGNKTYHEQLHDWLEGEFGKNHGWDSIVRQLLTAKGDNNDEGAVNYILAHVGENQVKNKESEDGQFDAVPLTSRSTRLFLGLQIQCTQCHDHPFNPEWKQSHFWGVNAFFRQVERDGNPVMRNNQPNMPAPKLTLKDNADYNKLGIVYFETRSGVLHATTMKFLDGKKVPAGSSTSRREFLAKFIIEHDQFGKAFVNRMWGHFFGHGLCQNPAVDDFGEHNQVVHPELLDNLAKSFKDYKYNVKELISWICKSDAYSLSCTANNTNNKPEHEVYFSRMLLKNMTPEQLYASLITCLDQPAPRGAKTKGPKSPAQMAAAKEEKAKKRQQQLDFLGKLTKNFGDDEGNEITFHGTVVQALLLMNGKEINALLMKPDNNTVAKAKGVDDLCIAALGRPATGKDRAAYGSGGDPARSQDFLWALINSPEFVLNH
ncbi:MAG TPA: DUF1549 domain-containing protein [Gemmataceae bacterium]|jgi:hypothetical protein|nr:DUF1549 domain-containing protein [Gemmataceae bacterium]